MMIKSLQTTDSKILIAFIILSLVACQNPKQSTNDSSNNQVVVPKVSSNKTGPNIDGNLLELRHQEGLVYYEDQAFTGTSISYYPNTKVLAKSIDYVDGKRNGYYKKWFPNELLSFESGYLNGQQHGVTKTWWKNGNLRSEANFEYGLAQGVQKQWYKSGAKFKRQELVDGKEQGLQQAWRENGKIYNNYEAKNGRIFGLKRANLCFSLENEEVIKNK